MQQHSQIQQAATPLPSKQPQATDSITGISMQEKIQQKTKLHTSLPAFYLRHPPDNGHQLPQSQEASLGRNVASTPQRASWSTAVRTRGRNRKPCTSVEWAGRQSARLISSNAGTQLALWLPASWVPGLLAALIGAHRVGMYATPRQAGAQTERTGDDCLSNYQPHSQSY